MQLSRLFLIIFLLILSGPAWGQDDYRLGPEDEIEIRVWSHDDLTRKIRVGLDGDISFPFVGTVKARGLTILELQKELERRMGPDYIVDPRVSIVVTEYKSQKFYVVGNVQKPGTYPLTKAIKVTEAISQAGGISSGTGRLPTSGVVAILVRARQGEQSDRPRLPDKMPADQKITVSMSAALAGDPKHNLEIKNGDTIYVPNLTVYVSGEVKTPGRYLYEENMTVLMAITMAQGLTDKASSRSVKIIRDQDGTKKTIKVNMDDPVRPGDNIVVPESWF